VSFHEDLKTDDWVRYYAASDCVGCNPVEVSKAAKARIAELEAVLKLIASGMRGDRILSEFELSEIAHRALGT